ncbi:MAG: hypothetical protein ACRDTF_20715 [Pseudonocardiaceae bacterium]
MSGIVSFAEIDGQRVELLPTRTLLQVGAGAAIEAVTPHVEAPAAAAPVPAAEATGPGAAAAV